MVILQAGDAKAALAVFEACRGAGHECSLKVYCQLIIALSKAERPHGRHEASDSAYTLWQELVQDGKHQLDPGAFRAGIRILVLSSWPLPLSSMMQHFVHLLMSCHFQSLVSVAVADCLSNVSSQHVHAPARVH